MATTRTEGKQVICEDEYTRITVDDKFCKGCDICVAFCPTEVLEMVRQRPRVKALEACTVCNLCEVRCPDFAIWVERLKTRPKKKKAANSKSSAAKQTA